MRLNKGKCEVLCSYKVANVHFRDGTPVQRKDQVKYLGRILNKECDMDIELKSRIATCMAVLKRMDLFRRQ